MAGPRERVEAALALDVADRPPVSAWGHNYDLEWDAAALARQTVERTTRLGFDFVKLQIRATTFAEVLGSEYRYSGDPRREPMLVHQPLNAPEGWLWVSSASATPALLDEQVECLRQVPVIQTLSRRSRSPVSSSISTRAGC